VFLGCHCRELRLSAVAGVPAYVELDWMNQESSMRNTEASTARTVKHHSNRVDTAKVVGVYIEGSTLQIVVDRQAVEDRPPRAMTA